MASHGDQALWVRVVEVHVVGAVEVEKEVTVLAGGRMMVGARRELYKSRGRRGGYEPIEGEGKGIRDHFGGRKEGFVPL